VVFLSFEKKNKVLSYKVGGSEMEWALRIASINGCEMDKRWF